LVKYFSLCLKWRLVKGVVKVLIKKKKRIGIEKSSSVYKSNNRFAGKIRI
jgi:hypothetical protein